MYNEMNGLQVLWHLLTNWEEGKGLWFIIGLAMMAVVLSVVSDRYEEYKHKPNEHNYY
nr:hypothetical protein [uncultured Mediterranean phage uvMED]|tara:strand:+ start:316 stop:489 length:174 start_codon:yes stop_codon:yes gene_type:complete